MSVPVDYEIVIPTIGRRSLGRLLDALTANRGRSRMGAGTAGRAGEASTAGVPSPRRIVVVDDSRDGAAAAIVRQRRESGLPGWDRLVLLRAGGRGPAAARNLGWRSGSARWVVFLDDDVLPPANWVADLAADLRAAGPCTAAVQGRISVPLPSGRRHTDWERQVAGLEGARWATADMACRRLALEQVGGFDERFRRNYREDADLGLRLSAAGWSIASGSRTIAHPVGPTAPWVSIARQAGNADDVLMSALHGSRWRARAGAPRGRLRSHLAIAGAGLLSLLSLARGRHALAATSAATWAIGTAELAWARIAPGPRDRAEVLRMSLTSIAIPFAASASWVRGQRRVARMRRARRRGAAAMPAAVLLDRDGTLIVDHPYNGDPALVEPMPRAGEALAMLRKAGVPTAVISNQSGIGRGLLSPEAVAAVNARVEALLGPLGPWVLCPHDPGDRCGCRKPAPGMVLTAARRLGVAPERCVLIGDVAADVQAALSAGAQAVMVPTPDTRATEVAQAPWVAPDLLAAVKMVLS